MPRVELSDGDLAFLARLTRQRLQKDERRPEGQETGAALKTELLERLEAAIGQPSSAGAKEPLTREQAERAERVIVAVLRTANAEKDIDMRSLMIGLHHVLVLGAVDESPVMIAMLKVVEELNQDIWAAAGKRPPEVNDREQAEEIVKVIYHGEPDS